MVSIVPPQLEKFAPKRPAVNFTTTLDVSNLKEKSVLITGGASGIGRACAQAIAITGAYVTIVDLQQETGESIAKDLSSKGFKVQFVKCDVTDYEAQTVAFQSAVKFGGGRLDVVIPSAGVALEGDVVNMAASVQPSVDSAPPEPGFKGVEINLKGVYYSSYLALHYFRLPAPSDNAPFKKSLVLIASIAGYIGLPFSTTYSMSKFGVRGILHGIRDQAYQADIRVNLVAPWYVRTPMVANTNLDPQLAAILEMCGFVPMEGVVDAVLRLAADEGLAGRCAAVFPEGNFDLGDDLWGGMGSVAQELLVKRYMAMETTMAELQKTMSQNA